mmetsp:Transcript_139325/g.277868  ORF Transcript_139325/g.277868 Transcript_139325/m.277868 type:complete len:347 (+) Transcript_139325:547-1587(+)
MPHHGLIFECKEVRLGLVVETFEEVCHVCTYARGKCPRHQAKDQTTDGELDASEGPDQGSGRATDDEDHRVAHVSSNFEELRSHLLTLVFKMLSTVDTKHAARTQVGNDARKMNTFSTREDEPCAHDNVDDLWHSVTRKCCFAKDKHQDRCAENAKSRRAKEQREDVVDNAAPSDTVPAAVNGVEQHDCHCVIDHRLAKNHCVQQWLGLVQTQLAEGGQCRDWICGYDQCRKDKVLACCRHRNPAQTSDIISDRSHKEKRHHCPENGKNANIFDLREKIQVVQHPATLEDDNGQQEQVQECSACPDHLVRGDDAAIDKLADEETKDYREGHGPGTVWDQSEMLDIT